MFGFFYFEKRWVATEVDQSRNSKDRNNSAIKRPWAANVASVSFCFWCVDKRENNFWKILGVYVFAESFWLVCIYYNRTFQELQKEILNDGCWWRKTEIRSFFFERQSSLWVDVTFPIMSDCSGLSRVPNETFQLNICPGEINVNDFLLLRWWKALFFFTEKRKFATVRQVPVSGTWFYHAHVLAPCVFFLGLPSCIVTRLLC